ncbi:hypothetical protein CVT26_010980 [Gymnopilus dilepis]|uniref:Uncharacterized protein n=1 Tax=Gymnopilus dilepis TaxID=231916 RepID=A0A409VJ94_9AGAR|nr:hypothetical protein CVT26_010980 [Gymnopilus dilepis]
MPLFGSRTTRHHHHTTPMGTRSSRSRYGFFHRKDRDRVAGGYKAALSNPNTSHAGRKHAKRELRLMGRGNETHVPFMTKVKRTLGIRSTPRRQRRLVKSSRY